MSDVFLEDLLYPDPKGEELAPTKPEESAEVEVVEPEVVEQEDEESEAAEIETEPKEEAGQTLHTVKTRGIEKQVNLEELKNGYQRNEDYTIATRELKEKEKALSDKESQANETLKVLTDIQGELDALIMDDLKTINWDELRQTDTAEYLRLKEVVEARKQSLKGVTEKRDKLMKDKFATEAAALHQALGWNSDAAKREAEIKQITDYAASQGITEQVTSHKLMIALLKAAQFDQLQKTKREVVEEPKTPPKITKPVKQVKAPVKKSLEERLYANS